MSDYKVPKEKVQATARIVGRGDCTVELFLSETAETHSGRERVSELLNRRTRFLALNDDETGYGVVNISMIISMSFDAGFEFQRDMLGVEDLAADLAVAAQVEVLLVDGSKVEGGLVYIQPEGQRRLQDYLNAAPAFIALRSDEQAHIINTHQVVQIRTISSGV